MRRALMMGVMVSMAAVAYAAVPQGEQLFVIERSKNANIVRYDVRLNASGQLDRDNPVAVYWVRHAEDGALDSLNWIERKMAYGINVTSEVRPTGFDMQLVSLEDRTLTVRRTDEGYRAETLIGGERAFLDKVYVASDESGVFPKVLYVELFGRSVASGEPAYEKLTNQ